MMPEALEVLKNRGAIRRYMPEQITGDGPHSESKPRKTDYIVRV